MTRMRTLLKLAVTLLALALTFGPALPALAQYGTLQLPESWPGQAWLWFIFFAVVIVAGIAMAVVARWQRKSLRRKFGLEINNLGNVRSRYELLADAPHGALKFQFTLHGDRLPQRQVPETIAVAGDAAADKTAPSDSPMTFGKIRGAAGWATGVAGAVANVFNTVGSLLPRSVGAPLLRVASQLRRGGSTVRRAERLPGQVTRLKPSASSSRATAERQASPVSHTVLRTWARTSFVEPGETLTVDLLISPVRARPGQPYPFTVLSRSVEQEGAPPVIEEGNIQIEEASWVRRYGPFVAILATAIAILALTFWLASTGTLVL